MKFLSLKLQSNIPDQAPDLTVKKVYVKRRDSIGDYAAYIGRTQVLVEMSQKDLIEEVKKLYPNAEIIEK